MVGDAVGVERKEGAGLFSLLRRLYGCEDIFHIADRVVQRGSTRLVGSSQQRPRGVVAIRGRMRRSSRLWGEVEVTRIFTQFNLVQLVTSLKSSSSGRRGL